MNKVHRLFVGNLPAGIVEQELKNEFSAYGRVKNVEIKNKINAEEIINTFAFILLDTDGHSLKQCLSEFKSEKYKGRFLNVTVARENFLDKLKREREEVAGRINDEVTVKSTSEEATSNNYLPMLIAKTNSSKDHSSEDDSSDESVVDQPTAVVGRTTKINEDDFVIHKKSNAYIENGVVKINAKNSGGAAIHIIQRNRKEVKHFNDDKAKEADKKRMESLGKMKDAYNQQKLAIKNALAKVDSSGNKKILFHDDSLVPNDNPASRTLINDRTRSVERKTLFEDNDDAHVQDYSNDFKIREQYQGASGARLLKLQSRFQKDNRFNMDERFLEDSQTDFEQAAEPMEVMKDDERNWQYEILKSVMGKELRTGEVTENVNKFQTQMLRYDPSIQEHTKYLAKNKIRSNDHEPLKFEQKNHTKSTTMMDSVTELPEVTQEQFYKVSKNLTASLAKSTAAFSLLSMFGTTNTHEEAATTSSSKNMYQSTLLTKNPQKVILDMTNPFKYDSSDDELNAESFIDKLNKNKPAVDVNENKSKQGTMVLHEKFFIFADDDRLKDGALFFIPVEQNENYDEFEFENKQKEMRNVIKKKIKRSIKTALPHGAKPNKRFRKFVRNL